MSKKPCPVLLKHNTCGHLTNLRRKKTCLKHLWGCKKAPSYKISFTKKQQKKPSKLGTMYLASNNSTISHGTYIRW